MGEIPSVKYVDDDSLLSLAQKKGALAAFLEEKGKAACYPPLSHVQVVFRTEVRYAEMLCVAESEEEKRGIISARNERRLGNIEYFDEVLERTAQFKDLATIEFEADQDSETTYLRALGKAATGGNVSALAVITTGALDLKAIQQRLSYTEIEA